MQHAPPAPSSRSYPPRRRQRPTGFPPNVGPDAPLTWRTPSRSSFDGGEYQLPASRQSQAGRAATVGVNTLHEAQGVQDTPTENALLSLRRRIREEAMVDTPEGDTAD